MSYPRLFRFAAFAALATPAVAAAEPLTPVLLMAHAAPLVKLIMLSLALATLAAIVLGTRGAVRRTCGPRTAAFLSALKLAGPLFGALGAAYGLLNMSLGLANVAALPPVQVLARGWAEAAFMLGLGFLAGGVAVLAGAAAEKAIPRSGLTA